MRSDLQKRLKRATKKVIYTGVQPRSTLDSTFNALEIELRKRANTDDVEVAERLTEARDMLLNSWRLVLKAHKT